MDKISKSILLIINRNCNWMRIQTIKKIMKNQIDKLIVIYNKMNKLLLAILTKICQINKKLQYQLISL